MTPLPTILALGDARVHVGTPNYSSYISNIETPVDNFLGVVTILVVPNVDLDYCYV